MCPTCGHPFEEHRGRPTYVSNKLRCWTRVPVPRSKQRSKPDGTVSQTCPCLIDVIEEEELVL